MNAFRTGLPGWMINVVSRVTDRRLPRHRHRGPPPREVILIVYRPRRRRLREEVIEAVVAARDSPRDRVHRLCHPIAAVPGVADGAPTLAEARRCPPVEAVILVDGNLAAPVSKLDE